MSSSNQASSSQSCRPERYAEVAQLLGELRQFSSVFGPVHGASIGQCSNILNNLHAKWWTVVCQIYDSGKGPDMRDWPAFLRGQITDTNTLDAILYIAYQSEIHAFAELSKEKKSRLDHARRLLGWSTQQQFLLDYGPKVAVSTAAVRVFVRLRSPGKTGRSIFSAAAVSAAVRDAMLRRVGSGAEPPVAIVADVLEAEKTLNNSEAEAEAQAQAQAQAQASSSNNDNNNDYNDNDNENDKEDGTSSSGLPLGAAATATATTDLETPRGQKRGPEASPRESRRVLRRRTTEGSFELLQEEEGQDEVEATRATAQRLSGDDHSSLLDLFPLARPSPSSQPPSQPGLSHRLASILHHCTAILELGPGRVDEEGAPMALSIDAVLASARVLLVTWEASNRARGFTEE